MSLAGFVICNKILILLQLPGPVILSVRVPSPSLRKLPQPVILLLSSLHHSRELQLSVIFSTSFYVVAAADEMNKFCEIQLLDFKCQEQECFQGYNYFYLYI